MESSMKCICRKLSGLEVTFSANTVRTTSEAQNKPEVHSPPNRRNRSGLAPGPFRSANSPPDRGLATTSLPVWQRAPARTNWDFVRLQLLPTRRASDPPIKGDGRSPCLAIRLLTHIGRISPTHAWAALPPRAGPSPVGRLRGVRGEPRANRLGRDKAPKEANHRTSPLLCVRGMRSVDPRQGEA